MMVTTSRSATCFAIAILLGACNGGGGTDVADGGPDAGGSTGDGGGNNGTDGGSKSGGDDGGNGNNNGGPILDACSGEPAGTVCREATGPCDIAEECDGESPDCPADSLVSDGTSCAEGCEAASCMQGECVMTGTCPVYVDPEGSDGEGCGEGWGEDACATLEGGSAEAVRTESNRVFVRQGIHVPDSGGDPVLEMREGIAYYGGFAGDEDRLEDRPMPVEDPTTLDGENASEHVVIGASNGRLDGFRVIGGVGPIGAGMYNVEVSDLTVAHGRFEENVITVASQEGIGAGVYNGLATNVAFENVVLANNSITATGDESNPSAFGAGMANFESSVSLTDVRFEGNQMSADNLAEGGGLYNEGCEDVSLTRVRFAGNESEGLQVSGAGMASFFSKLTLSEVEIVDNTLTPTDGPVGAGAGMYDEGCESSLSHVRFDGNRGEHTYGGGYAVIPGAEGAGSAELDDVAFTGNSATGGGGMSTAASEGDATLTVAASRVLFQGNDSVEQGGGLSAADTTLTLTDSTFVNNTVSNGEGEADGGGLVVIRGRVVMDGVQIVGNSVNGVGFASGGGMTISEATTETHMLTGVDFVQNRVSGENDAVIHGGGLSTGGPVLLALSNASFAGNTASPDAAATDVRTFGGGLSIVNKGGDSSTAEVTISHVTFAGNRVSGDAQAVGGGLFVEGSGDEPTALATARNLVFGDNFAGDESNNIRTFGETGVNLELGEICEVVPENLEADLAQAASGHWFLTEDSTCVNWEEGDALADANDTFGDPGTWHALTTQMNGATDMGAPDLGRHYNAGGPWIRTFEVDGGEASWTVRAPEGTTCLVNGGGLDDHEVPEGEVDSGNATLTETSGDVTLSCESQGVIVRATASL